MASTQQQNINSAEYEIHLNTYFRFLLRSAYIGRQGSMRYSEKLDPKPLGCLAENQVYIYILYICMYDLKMGHSKAISNTSFICTTVGKSTDLDFV